MEDSVHAVEFPASFAVVPQDAAVELQHLMAPGHLVQPVYILRNNGRKLSCSFKLCKLKMC